MVSSELRAASNARTWKRYVRNFIFGVTLYIAFCAIMITSPMMQSILVYLHIFPTSFYSPTDLHGLGIANNTRNIIVRTSDGLELRGYHMIPDSSAQAVLRFESHDQFYDSELQKAARVVIYLHGNGATRAQSHRLHIIQRMARELSAHVITVDYRGFGDSPGWPSEMGTRTDAHAVLDWLVQRISSAHHPPAVFLYGHSLGTGVALDLVADLEHSQWREHHKSRLIKGVIVDSAFSSLVDASLTHPIGFIFRVVPMIRDLM